MECPIISFLGTNIKRIFKIANSMELFSAGFLMMGKQDYLNLFMRF
jgi:hypothetical protein